MQQESSHRLARVLYSAFLLVMFIATGPGVLLVNSPRQIWGIPLIYLWGIVWYFAIVFIASVAYLFLWKSSSDPTDSEEQP